jgi:hypothetical protein
MAATVATSHEFDIDRHVRHGWRVIGVVAKRARIRFGVQMRPSFTEYGDGPVIEETEAPARIAQSTVAMLGTRPRSGVVSCGGRRPRWVHPSPVVIVVRGEHATAAFAYSVLVTVQDPADVGPRPS